MPEELTDGEILNQDTLKVGDGGHVEGTIWTRETDRGFSVSASVTSYDYRRREETRTNHVPHVVITDETGAIVAEPETHDSSNPERAINNARTAALFAFRNIESYVD